MKATAGLTEWFSTSSHPAPFLIIKADQAGYQRRLKSLGLVMKRSAAAFGSYVDDESTKLVLLQGDDLVVARLLSQTQHRTARRQAQTWHVRLPKHTHTHAHKIHFPFKCQSIKYTCVALLLTYTVTEQLYTSKKSVPNEKRTRGRNPERNQTRKGTSSGWHRICAVKNEALLLLSVIEANHS